jgi:hypothetical protein
MSVPRIRLAMLRMLLHQRALYSRCNIKLKRTAALSEWRQRCSAQVAVFGSRPRLVRICLTALLGIVRRRYALLADEFCPVSQLFESQLNEKLKIGSTEPGQQLEDLECPR